MRIGFAATPRLIDRVSPRLLMLWAGLSLGVAFLATPVKFMAPSLSLPVALDVGRQTFRVYNDVELALLAVLVVLAALSKAWRARLLALSVPGLMIVTQALYLIPALDERVSTILAGGQAPPSNLHTIYIAAEVIKVLWLLGFGLGQRSRSD